MVNNYQSFDQPLTHEMMFKWHQCAVGDKHYLRDIGRYRSSKEPMQVVSGHVGSEKIHFVENQEKWPQQKHQKPGCGFPQAALCACFNLDNGALLSYELGNKKSHDLPMLRQQSDTFKAGDIFLGDKGFCSYYDQSTFKDKGVDSVVTLARRKPVSASNAIKVIGEDDLLITAYKALLWRQLCTPSTKCAASALRQVYKLFGCGARNLLKICQTKNVMSWFAFYINQLLEISSWKDREGVNLEQSNEGPKTINYY